MPPPSHLHVGAFGFGFWGSGFGALEPLQTPAETAAGASPGAGAGGSGSAGVEPSRYGTVSGSELDEAGLWHRNNAGRNSFWLTRGIGYTPAVHLVLAADDSKDDLQRELVQAFADVQAVAAGAFAVEPRADDASLPLLAFARQILPQATAVEASSIKAWATVIADAVAGVLPDHQPWSLHVFPFKPVVTSSRQGARAWHSRARAGAPPLARPQASSGAGLNRCRLITEAVTELLQKRRRHLLRSLRPQPLPFVTDEALVQVLLSSPDAGYLSLALAPQPHEQRQSISHFPGGQVALAVDKQAPSRAFTKLVEAEARMGRRILGGETCVDLGAAPGSWTYVAARRGAKVIAVDRSPLRDDLMHDRRVRFQQGDAFRFEPEAPVDWLVCDVIAAAERSANLLLRWLEQGYCQHFVVTLKLDDAGSTEVLARLKQRLPELTSELWLNRLCANKKEVCAFGTRKLGPFS